MWVRVVRPKGDFRTFLEDFVSSLPQSDCLQKLSPYLCLAKNSMRTGMARFPAGTAIPSKLSFHAERQDSLPGDARAVYVCI